MGRKRFNDADYERMAEMRERGLSCAQIGILLGCSTELVSWTCLKLGADPPNAKPLRDCIVGPAVMARGDHLVRRFTPDDDALLIGLESEGLNPSQIGRRMGRAPNSVRGRLMTLARREARRELA